MELIKYIVSKMYKILWIMPSQLNADWAMKHWNYGVHSAFSASYSTGIRNSSKTDTTW